jgi:xylulokinase
MAFLGIDLGTSAVKALIIDDNGRVLASASAEYPLSTPRPMWSEQRPEDWWAGSVTAIRAALAAAGVSGADIRGIGLSGQMHGLTLLDKAGRVLRPAMLWNDQRTGAQARAMIDAAGGLKGTRRLLTNIPNPSFTAPKILWVREHEPRVYAKIAHVLLPKDYVRYRLSGAFATEVSDATGMALLDVRKRVWSDKVLSLLDIPKAWLPEVAESHVPTTTVSALAAEATGLRVGTPIVGGGGDQPAAGVGAGAVREGIVVTTIGTSGVIFAAINAYTVVEGGLETFCHAVPGMWHFMGVMLSAGGSLRWHRDTLAFGDPALVTRAAISRDPYDVMFEGAQSIQPGAEGLRFLPYLTGERTPHLNPNATGAFVGLTLRHTPQHLTRAVIEGITFGLRDSLELIRGAGVTIKEVRTVGGGAKSALWRQMLADIFNTEITVLNITEGGAYGVALLAGVGTGHWATAAEACDATLKVTGRVKPSRNRAVRAAYDDAYAQWRALYPALNPKR